MSITARNNYSVVLETIEKSPKLPERLLLNPVLFTWVPFSVATSSLDHICVKHGGLTLPSLCYVATVTNLQNVSSESIVAGLVDIVRSSGLFLDPDGLFLDHDCRSCPKTSNLKTLKCVLIMPLSIFTQISHICVQ